MKKYRKDLTFFVQSKQYFISYYDNETGECVQRKRIYGRDLTPASQERFVDVSMRQPVRNIVF
jgi:hypothetical protein